MMPDVAFRHETEFPKYSWKRKLIYFRILLMESTYGEIKKCRLKHQNKAGITDQLIQAILEV